MRKTKNSMQIIHPKTFIDTVFYLYYARGSLQAKLKHYSDAISSFTASIDARNYSKVLRDDSDLAREELINHKQILKSAERSIADKSNSSADLSIKASSVKLAGKYKQIITFYEDLVTKSEIITPPDFSSMFDIPLSESRSDAESNNLQYGYAHYHKGLCQTYIDKHKEAIESFNIVNQLLPNFSPAYIQKAHIYKELKQLKKALVQYDAAIRLEYDNAELFFARSTLLFELGKTDLAKEDFNRYKKLQDE